MKRRRPWLLFAIGLPMVGFAAWYGWKRCDYLDGRGNKFLTLGEVSTPAFSHDRVAEYVGTTPDGDTLVLLLQRGILHLEGRQQFTSGLFLDPLALQDKGNFLNVRSTEGDALYQRGPSADGSGYTITEIQYLASGLIAIGPGPTDRVELALEHQLQPFPTDPPNLPWWYEPFRIMTSP